MGLMAVPGTAKGRSVHYNPALGIGIERMNVVKQTVLK